MLKINQAIKLNSQVEVKILLKQPKETQEYDRDISLEGRHDAFHAKENERSILLEAKGACPYKRHLNALRIYA